MMKKQRLLLTLVIVFLFVFTGSLVASESNKGKPPFDEELVVVTNLGAEQALPNLGSGIDLSLWGHLYDYLLMRDSKTGLVTQPGAAKSLDISKDYKTYTFHLHTGIQFHDGWGELTAEDVIFTFNLASRKDSLNTRGKYFRSIVEKVEAVDPYTVTFHLKKPDWQFKQNCSNFLPLLSILSKKYVEKVGEKQANLKPIGSGPYKLIDRRSGDYIKFEAVADHRRHVPDFKYITLKDVSEPATRIAMLKAGEADIVAIAADKVPEIQKAGFRTVRVPGSRLYWVVFPSLTLPTREGFNPNVPWWADPKDKKEWERALKVRKALNLAVNRQEIVDTLFLGNATLYGCTYFWPGQPGADPAWKPYPYDPEQAKKLLAEAGYPNGFEVEMVLLKHVGRPEAPQLGEAVAMYWENIGLKVKRVPMEFATLRPVMYQRKVKRFWVYGMPWYDEPIIAVMRQGVSDTRYFTGAAVAEIEALARKAFAVIDPGERAELQRQVGQMFYDGYYTVPLAGKDTIFALSNRVKDWPFIPGVGYPQTNLQFVTLKR